MTDKDKQRLKMFLIDYIEMCKYHNMHFDICYSEGVSDGELEIIDEENNDITTYDNRYFEYHIHSIVETGYLFDIFDELKQLIRKE